MVESLFADDLDYVQKLKRTTKSKAKNNNNASKELTIQLNNISKTFKVKEANLDTIQAKVFNVFKKNPKKVIKAVQPVSLNIHKGEVFGIVGRNGSGKSTLLQMIMGSIKPDKGGEIITKGKLMRLSLGIGFDSTSTARENIYINGIMMGLTKKHIDSKFDKIIEFAELENFVDVPVKVYSKGMRSRLAFAIAMHAEADIFLFDEFFGGVGDLRFKEKSDELFKSDFIKNKTIVLVSHSLKTIEQYCKRVLCIDKGNIIGVGPTEIMVKKYREIMKKK